MPESKGERSEQGAGEPSKNTHTLDGPSTTACVNHLFSRLLEKRD